jgi:hypothetical protein
MSKTYFVKKEPKHPIVAVAQLFKSADMKVEDAWGVMIKLLAEDGTIDQSQPTLMIPLGQLKELIAGKYADAAVQQYEPYKPKPVTVKK